MSDLRTAAQQALEALEDVDGPITALLGSLLGSPDADAPGAKVRTAITALRAALAQQAEPQGCATEEDCTKQPWCRIRGECQRKQAEPLNLSDPAVQKRLASQWGYVPAAAQAEPAQEPVAWSGYDLDGMVEAFSRVIEAHYQRANPFQHPIDMDAQMALRVLRGFIPAMKAYAAIKAVEEGK